MREARIAVALSLALVLVAPGVGAWSQYHGNAARSGLATLQEAPLDVVANVRGPEGFLWSPSAAPSIETAHGPLLQRIDGDGCHLSILAPDGTIGREIDLTDCGLGGVSIGGYDRASDLVFLCRGGQRGDRQVTALRASNGDEVWGFSASAVPQPPAGFTLWYCGGMAYDESADELLVVLASNAQGQVLTRLVSLVASTGTMNWARATSATVSALPDTAPLPTGPTEAPAEQIYPRVLTLTDTGIVLLSTGEMAAPFGAGGFASFRPVMTLFDRSGQQTGSYQGQPSSGGGVSDTALSSASWYAVGKGALASLVFAGEVVQVNPELGAIVARAPLQAPDETALNIWWPAGAWLTDRVVMALPHSIVGVDPTTLAPAWAYTNGTGTTVREVIGTTRGEVVVLMADLEAGTGAIVVLDGSTGAVLRRLPLPFPIERVESSAALLQIQPLSDGGLLVFSGQGHVARYGRAEPTRIPALDVSTDFPAVGEAFEVAVSTYHDDAVRTQIDWGDGTTEEPAVGRAATHGYAEAGARTFRVTTTYASGLTGTALYTVHVGGTPPPQLTAMQRAFSPENQEMTFFLLGTLITIVGLAFTIGRHRRRFNRLEQELAAVEEIRFLSTTDPHGAVQALKAYRERLPSDLAKRRIDDSQYQVLDLRSARLLKVLRTRMFAPFDTRLSMRYHRLLDAAFEDAILQPSEASALVTALDQEEALRPGDRDEIVRLLAEFTSHNIGVALR